MQSQNLKLKTELKHRSYKFSVSLLKYIQTLPNSRVYWVIIDQLMRSATSIGANIIEARAASSKRDFIKFFEIALKSANETMYWLCLLRDTTEADGNKIKKYLEECQEISKILGASLLTLKNKR